MIRLIGNHGCSRCEMTKKILENKGIEYTYEYLSNLSEAEQTDIMEMAKEKGMMAMPMILRDNKLIDMKEI
jgi:glutaredoxin